MKTFGNILWLIFGGLISAIMNFIMGVVCFITIIFIPVGFQLFKIAKFFLWPMGKKVVKTNINGFKTFVNIIWLIIMGWVHFIGYGLAGCILCATVIGIPFGLQYFKMAKFAALPLGHDFVKEDAVSA